MNILHINLKNNFYQLSIWFNNLNQLYYNAATKARLTSLFSKLIWKALRFEIRFWAESIVVSQKINIPIIIDVVSFNIWFRYQQSIFWLFNRYKIKFYRLNRKQSDNLIDTDIVKNVQIEDIIFVWRHFKQLYK